MTVSLEKRTADAEASIVSLLKREQARGIDLGELVAQVEIAIDFSVSMRHRFASGEVQAVVERALALSLSGLDDDGVVPVHFFHHSTFPPELVTRENYPGFVDQWAARHKMGRTAYAPTIAAVLDGTAKRSRFGRGRGPDLEGEKNAPPKFVIFVSDGAPSDRARTTRLLVEAASRPVFWHFIGLGYTPAFLHQLDEMGDRVVDNVGLTEYESSRELSDQQFFDDVIGEFFTSWLPAARRLGITRC